MELSNPAIPFSPLPPAPSPPFVLDSIARVGWVSRGITQGRKRKRVILILFYYFARQSPTAKKRRDPLNPPISEQSLRPLLPSFLSSLHLDLRRKWTFYETEITTLRQSEGLSSSRGQSQKREYFHLPTLDRLFNLVPGHRMTLLERLHSTCTIFIIFSEIGHSLFYLSALANRHGSGNGPSYISVFCAPPMIQHRRTVTT